MLCPGEAGCSRSVRSSLEVAWEENSRPLSVEGLTTAEAASELVEEMGVGTSMNGTPPAKKSKSSLREKGLWAKHILHGTRGCSQTACSSLHMLVSKLARVSLKGEQTEVTAVVEWAV